MRLHWTNPSAAAAAYVGGGPERFLAVSLYGQFVGGSSYAAMLHHSADLSLLLNDFTTVNRLIVAGDLNLNGQWSGTDAWYNDIERSILDTFTMWRMRDVLAGADVPATAECPCAMSPCRHVQTYWKPGSATPWQNDHAFASPALKVASISVDSSAVTEHKLSDHAPLVLEIE
jgi:endonuclease/exonuclease/phosphatase family metal-dependent hydrolase